jgi:hypothetical protein
MVDEHAGVIRWPSAFFLECDALAESFERLDCGGELRLYLQRCRGLAMMRSRSCSSAKHAAGAGSLAMGSTASQMAATIRSSSSGTPVSDCELRGAHDC